MVVLGEGFNSVMILKMCHHEVSSEAQYYPLIQYLEEEIIHLSLYFTQAELFPEA